MRVNTHDAGVAVDSQEPPAFRDSQHENPVLPLIPSYSSAREARLAIELVPQMEAASDLSEDNHTLIPSATHGRLILDMIRSAQESARERDLSDEAFRAKILTAHQFLCYRRDEHGHSVPPVAVSLPGVQPKVHLAVVPNGVGQRAIIHACERVFGFKKQDIDVVPADGVGTIRFARLGSIVLNFPPNGSPRSFYRTLARKIDGVFKSGFGSVSRCDEEAGTAAQALLLAVNIGMVIIGPVSKGDSDPRRAAALWSMLADLAVETGLPMLIVVTPGAAANLIEHSGALSALTSRGVYSIEPLTLASKDWANIALMAWLKYLKAAAALPPQWFPTALWSQTLGRIELAIKVCAHIASTWQTARKVSLTEDEFAAHARHALVLESPRLRAILRAERGGEFSRAQVMANGDWLPLPILVESIPGLDERDDLFASTIYPALKVPHPEKAIQSSIEKRNKTPKHSAPQEGGVA
ncbi:TPA: hypothetical protein QDB24_006590 [Burkholderia vietnamiensis]|uniref:hypothetical protein n=1 Tax=Burkholderia vietnamiensis TaxID=60552 RepID=UPI001B9CAE58|nr:hypothetical protein [Burkholderia vietnamiensis]MBR7914134.1 hypothetical protein [Burkholderia vietnamiensis]HDR9278409.1 hypothetical protein [Burkholderia vietnamiensis]